jgi:hypothetical protein
MESAGMIAIRLKLRELVPNLRIKSNDALTSNLNQFITLLNEDAKNIASASSNDKIALFSVAYMKASSDAIEIFEALDYAIDNNKASNELPRLCVHALAKLISTFTKIVKSEGIRYEPAIENLQSLNENLCDLFWNFKRNGDASSMFAYRKVLYSLLNSGDFKYKITALSIIHALVSCSQFYAKQWIKQFDFSDQGFTHLPMQIVHSGTDDKDQAELKNNQKSQESKKQSPIRSLYVQICLNLLSYKDADLTNSCLLTRGLLFRLLKYISRDGPRQSKLIFQFLIAHILDLKHLSNAAKCYFFSSTVLSIIVNEAFEERDLCGPSIQILERLLEFSCEGLNEKSDLSQNQSKLFSRLMHNLKIFDSAKQKDIIFRVLERNPNILNRIMSETNCSFEPRSSFRYFSNISFFVDIMKFVQKRLCKSENLKLSCSEIFPKYWSKSSCTQAFLHQNILIKFSISKALLSILKLVYLLRRRITVEEYDHLQQEMSKYLPSIGTILNVRNFSEKAYLKSADDIAFRQMFCTSSELLLYYQQLFPSFVQEQGFNAFKILSDSMLDYPSQVQFWLSNHIVLQIAAISLQSIIKASSLEALFSIWQKKSVKYSTDSVFGYILTLKSSICQKTQQNVFKILIELFNRYNLKDCHQIETWIWIYHLDLEILSVFEYAVTYMLSSSFIANAYKLEFSPLTISVFSVLAEIREKYPTWDIRKFVEYCFTCIYDIITCIDELSHEQAVCIFNSLSPFKKECDFLIDRLETLIRSKSDKGLSNKRKLISMHEQVFIESTSSEILLNTSISKCSSALLKEKFEFWQLVDFCEKSRIFPSKLIESICASIWKGYLYLSSQTRHSSSFYNVLGFIMYSQYTGVVVDFHISSVFEYILSEEIEDNELKTFKDFLLCHPIDITKFIISTSHFGKYLLYSVIHTLPLDSILNVLDQSKSEKSLMSDICKFINLDIARFRGSVIEVSAIKPLFLFSIANRYYRVAYTLLNLKNSLHFYLDHCSYEDLFRTHIRNEESYDFLYLLIQISSSSHDFVLSMLYDFFEELQFDFVKESIMRLLNFYISRKLSLPSKSLKIIDRILKLVASGESFIVSFSDVLNNLFMFSETFKSPFFSNYVRKLKKMKSEKTIKDMLILSCLSKGASVMKHSEGIKLIRICKKDFDIDESNAFRILQAIDKVLDKSSREIKDKEYGKLAQLTLNILELDFVSQSKLELEKEVLSSILNLVVNIIHKPKNHVSISEFDSILSFESLLSPGILLDRMLLEALLKTLKQLSIEKRKDKAWRQNLGSKVFKLYRAFQTGTDLIIFDFLNSIEFDFNPFLDQITLRDDQDISFKFGKRDLNSIITALEKSVLLSFPDFSFDASTTYFTYDPRFMLPFFKFCLQNHDLIDLRLFVDTGCLSYVVLCMTAESAKFRGWAYDIFGQVYLILSGKHSCFDEQLELLLIARSLLNSVGQSYQQISRVLANFIARLILLVFNPTSPVLGVVFQRLILKKFPSFDLDDSPFWFPLYFGPEIGSKLINQSKEDNCITRSWIIQSLTSCVSSLQEFSSYSYRKAFESLMLAFVSENISHIERRDIIGSFQKIISLSDLRPFAYLVEHNGFLVWILNSLEKTVSISENSNLQKLLILARRAYENLIQIETESGDDLNLKLLKQSTISETKSGSIMLSSWLLSNFPKIKSEPALDLIHCLISRFLRLHQLSPVQSKQVLSLIESSDEYYLKYLDILNRTTLTNSSDASKGISYSLILWSKYFGNKSISSTFAEYESTAKQWISWISLTISTHKNSLQFSKSSFLDVCHNISHSTPIPDSIIQYAL